MARCLVLGANGFIGSHLVDALAENGHFVRCFDRYKTEGTVFANLQHHDLEIFSGDFLSRRSLEQALEDIEYVFHLISTTNPIISENDPTIDIETNVRMSIELFKLCSTKKIKKLIFASTGGAIYGNIKSKHPIVESVCPKPISPYAIGKLTIENYLRYFGKKHSLDYLVLRISNPYGPRQNTMSGQGVISIFLENTLLGKPINIFGDGNMVRDYIFIDDVVNMIVGSFEKNIINEDWVFNLGSGVGRTVNEIVSAIEKVVGKKLSKSYLPIPSTFVDYTVLDVHKFTGEFKVFPTIDIQDGIGALWQNLRAK